MVDWRQRADRVGKVAKGAAARAKDVELGALRDAAIEASGVTNPKGEVKKWRVAKVVANPVGTIGKVGKASSRELAKQQLRAGLQRQGDCSDTDEPAKPERPPF